MVNKDNCVICKTESLYDKEEHIDFRIGYIETSGQLCLKCFGEVYNLKPKLSGMKKLINKIKRKGKT